MSGVPPHRPDRPAGLDRLVSRPGSGRPARPGRPIGEVVPAHRARRSRSTQGASRSRSGGSPSSSGVKRAGSGQATTIPIPAAARARTWSATNVPRPGSSWDGYQRATTSTLRGIVVDYRPDRRRLTEAGRHDNLQRLMNMTQNAPQAFRTSATRPGPIALVGQALGEIRSRRRLIGYLARADMKKKGADTLFGNIWWILDPLLQMAVYVILVTVIFQRTSPAYPLFIFAAILPWKWFTTVDERRHHLGQRPGSPDQAGPVPEARPAPLRADQRDRPVRLRPHPAGRR